jgi:hypothetical protein
VELNPAVGETYSIFGVAVGDALAIIALWREQNSSEENIADQERQTARKRMMDLTGRRSNTSSTITSGSDTAEPDAAAIFLLLLLTAVPDTAAILLPSIMPPPVCRLGLSRSAVKLLILVNLLDGFHFNFSRFR